MENNNENLQQQQKAQPDYTGSIIPTCMQLTLAETTNFTVGLSNLTEPNNQQKAASAGKEELLWKL